MKLIIQGMLNETCYISRKYVEAGAYVLVVFENQIFLQADTAFAFGVLARVQHQEMSLRLLVDFIC